MGVKPCRMLAMRSIPAKLLSKVFVPSFGSSEEIGYQANLTSHALRAHHTPRHKIYKVITFRGRAATNGRVAASRSRRSLNAVSHVVT